MQFLDIFVSKGVFCLDFWIITLIKSKNSNDCFDRPLACVASISVRFRSKERGTRVKDRAKMAQGSQVKERGSRLISRAIKTENPLPRSLFAPKPNGNACYAG